MNTHGSLLPLMVTSILSSEQTQSDILSWPIMAAPILTLMTYVHHYRALNGRDKRNIVLIEVR